MIVISAGGQVVPSDLSSFRDPAGTCRVFANRVFRLLKADEATELELFLATRTARQFCQHRRLVQTRRLLPEEAAELQEFSVNASEGFKPPFVLSGVEMKLAHFPLRRYRQGIPLALEKLLASRIGWRQFIMH